MKRILIINGVNLNMTGKREPEIYGKKTLEQINASLEAFAKGLGVQLTFFQSNCEGEICTAIQRADCPVIINAGAYTHYSYAIRDALSSVSVRKIEVHMSNVHSREEFRHNSVISAVVDGVICGFGEDSYRLAIRGLTDEKE